jgi:hypothetical protein
MDVGSGRCRTWSVGWVERVEADASQPADGSLFVPQGRWKVAGDFNHWRARGRATAIPDSANATCASD